MAWMRRAAGVTCRRNQVWSRTDREETILVIGEPELTGDWGGYSATMRAFGKFLAAWSKHGWCHRVVSLEKGSVAYMNEVFFSQSEQGTPSLYARLA